MSEEDKKYFENVKLELLESIDKSSMKDDIKKGWQNSIKEVVAITQNSNNSIEHKKRLWIC